jgi:hypothetical protein
MREGVDRITGLLLWTDWGEKGGYLPLILPLLLRLATELSTLTFPLSGASDNLDDASPLMVSALG